MKKNTGQKLSEEKAGVWSIAKERSSTQIRKKAYQEV